MPSLRDQPLHFQHFNVSFPAEHVVQVTINRPDKLNCINKATSREIAGIWERFDQDETLWVGIITGVGRAFCTGADLHGKCSDGGEMAAPLAAFAKFLSDQTQRPETPADARAEWNAMNQAGVVNDMAAPGLAGLPRRAGKKPVIAAVNGLCMGGGFEMVANCDVVIAASSAEFSLPEVKRGIVPVAGCLPRLARTIGLQRTMDLVLTGRSVDARTLSEWGLVTRVVDAASDGDVARAAVQVAQEMCRNSPDALIVGRMGVRMTWEDGSVEDAVTALDRDWYPRLREAPNFAEGIRAFVEKRPPNWLDSKL
jgi:enoyl-CoA hydratase/carnithine racemase